MTAPLLTSAQVAPRGNRSDGPAGSGPVGRAASRGPSWPWRCGCGPWCQRPPTGLSTQTAETRIANPPRPDDASCSAPRGALCGEVGAKVPGRLGARGHGSGDHTEAPRHAMSPELGDPPPSDQRADLCSPRMCVDVRAFALGWRPRAPCDGNDGDMCPGHSPAGCVTVTPPTRGGAFRSVLVTVTPPTGGGAFRSVLVLILGPRCSPLSQFQGPSISKQGVAPYRQHPPQLRLLQGALSNPETRRGASPMPWGPRPPGPGSLGVRSGGQAKRDLSRWLGFASCSTSLALSLFI